MCWLRTGIHRGGRAVVGMVMVVALAVGLMGVAAPAASAYEPGNYPTLQVTLAEGPGRIMGMNWGQDDSVTIIRTRGSTDVVLSDNVVTGSPFPGWLEFPVMTGVLMVGDTVTVTGNDTVPPYSREVEIVALAVTSFDVPDHQLSGTKASSDAGWGDLRASLGNMFPGGGTQVTVPADQSTTWAAELPAADFELMEGVGASVWQSDPDGDTLQVIRQVPNPTIVIDDHGVSMSGWWPGSTLHVYLDDDADHSGGWPYDYTVTADGTGDFCCQPPPDPQWQPIRPDWVARVVGAYPTRDHGTVTKEATYVALPVPDLSGSVLSGLVPGTLTDSTVGAGSLVYALGNCPSAGDNPVTRVAYATSGTYTVDFSAVVQQPWGWGGPCTDAVYYSQARVRDLDGDEVRGNWFTEPAPVVTVDPIVTDGGEMTVEGTGWDLTTIRVEQCELLGDVVGECDPGTVFWKLSSPDFSGWPSTMARFGENTVARQYLNLADDRVVDCAEAPGTCAVVATEEYRPEVSAFAALTYETPYWVELAVTVAPAGTVSSVSGTATIRGTVTASDPVWVHLTGELRQRLGRRVVAGWVDTWRFVDEPGVPIAWEVQVMSYNGYAFGSGSAEMTAWVDLGDEGPTDGASSGPVIVKLTMVRPPKPPRR